MTITTCAISPCPNDTYLFHAWIHGLVGQDLPIETSFADIEQLNEWALSGKFPLIKLSMGCFADVADRYQLLPIGSALGFNCGPKIIARTPFKLSELADKTIAIPGTNTTAHLLLNRLQLKPKEKHFCLYHEIFPLLAAKTVDCGLIIHESRFTYENEGFVEIADLGEMWHSLTALPLPLGGIAIARALPVAVKNRIASILRESILFAKKEPEKGIPFILSKAQEKEGDIVRKHIETYVNSETESLSVKGKQAIETLIRLPQDWLYHA